MAQTHSSVVVTYMDYDKETTTIEVKGAPVLSDGTNYVAVYTAAMAVVTALDALALGTKISQSFTAERDIFQKNRPSSKVAQRETKLFIAGEQAGSFANRKLTLGTFDPDELADIPENTPLPSYLDLTAGTGLALKQALDSYWTGAPDYLTQVTTQSAVHVGRNT